MEITNILILKKEIILGYLFEYKKLTNEELNLLNKQGKKIELSLIKYDILITSTLSINEKKNRNHILITFGALIEIANIKNYNLSILSGYFYNLNLKNKEYKNKCFELGFNYFSKKEEK